MRLFLTREEYDLFFKLVCGYPKKKIKSEIGWFGLTFCSSKEERLVEGSFKKFIEIIKKRFKNDL